MAQNLYETYTMLRRQGLRELNLSPITTEGSDDGVWFTDLMRSAVRRAYWPGPVAIRQGQIVTPDWSFLKLMATLTVYGEYNTGTVEVANGSDEVTITDGVWASWLDNFVVTPTITITEADGTEVECDVDSRKSGSETTVLILSSAWSSTTASGLSFVLSAPESYSAYNSILGPVLVTDPLPVRPFGLTDWMYVQGLQAQSAGCSGSSGYVGLRTTTKAGSSVQAFRMNVWPQFDGTLKYPYRLTPSMVDAADTLPETYAYGPPWFHEVMLESVLAVCEERRDGIKGLHNQNFQAALSAAVIMDMNSEPEIYGTIQKQGAEQGDTRIDWSGLSHLWPRSGTMAYQ